MSHHQPDSVPQYMRAWTFSRQGSAEQVLQLSEQHPTPTLRSDTSVLIRVTHVSLHPGTTIMMNFVPFFFRKAPSIAETDFAGVIISAGQAVPVTPSPPNEHRYFPPGTAVFGSISVGSHLKGAGALAEYLVVEMHSIARKPPNISFAQAAALPVSGATALTLMDAAGVQPGDRVLINAPCGGIGHFVTQLVSQAVSKNGYIVGRCSAASFETAKALGCNDVVSYSSAAERDSSSSVGIGEAFDKVIDAHGSQDLWHSSPGILKAGLDHAYTSVGPVLSSYTYRDMLLCVLRMGVNAFLPAWAGGVNRGYRQVTSIVDSDKLERLRQLCGADQLTVLVGGTWAFEDALQAFEVLRGKHARGKLVICVAEPSLLG
ncbi:chaperonin 10-like protein [Aspergillus coremiiformis]|uniref:Chaperonin 10-like protein n=1 Tax=Aspergillus coremiiformis TaxID=138285 RepID=A0A5N6ZH33_9EURO|nr:chaperonin 10-like protein [Aspergillus coremiiformis]